MVKSSLLYVIRNRSNSHLESQFWIIQTQETQHIENKSLNREFQRYILFFISVLWVAIYQLNQKYIYMYK